MTAVCKLAVSGKPGLSLGVAVVGVDVVGVGVVGETDGLAEGLSLGVEVVGVDVVGDTDGLGHVVTAHQGPAGPVGRSLLRQPELTNMRSE